jgi:hypothetical protein
VLFATTRAPAPPEAPEHYPRRAGDAVRLDVARVQLGEPGWSFEDLVKSDLTSRPEAPRPARVVAVEEFGVFSASGSAAEREFVAAIDHEVERSPRGEVVLYVPGYRATFDQVMVLLGSWAHFLGRHSPVIAFSWLTREDLETLASNERLVSVDVTGVYGPHGLSGMRGHGYWVANQRVSSDVLLSMVYPFDPAWRGLVHGPGRGLWTFPDDYPRRVGDAVYQAAPAVRRQEP